MHGMWNIDASPPLLSVRNHSYDNYKRIHWNKVGETLFTSYGNISFKQNQMFHWNSTWQ